VNSAWKAYGRYSTVGLELVVSIAVGWALGRWLDGRFFGSHGYATFAGAVVGVYTGFRGLWKAAKMMQAEAEREDREQADKLAKGEPRPREEGDEAEEEPGDE